MLQKPLSYVTGDDLAQIIRSGRNKHAIIDLRDDDWVRGNIRTATHIPSREFDYERAKRLAQELEQNKIENVVFHCHFSQQRGPTGAGLFRRVLEVELPDSKMDVYVVNYLCFNI
jgi:Cdc25 family phosphatase